MTRPALIRKTLRDARGVTIGIALVIAAMAFVDVLIYPSYSETLKDFEMPAAMEGFLGEATNIATPEGFLTAEFFAWIPLLLITLAVIAGTAAFAGEEGSGTLDLLLAQPVKRWRLAVEKGVALTACVVIAALASLPGFWLAEIWVEVAIGRGRLVAAVVNMLPVALLFLMLSLWLSAAFPSRASAAILVTGLVVVTYFVQLIGDLTPVLESARKASPFYWAEPSRVLVHGFDWWRASGLLAVAVLFGALAVWSLERREIAQGSREWSLRVPRPFHRVPRPTHRPRQPEATAA
jgi:ABC-2 type transport system permease protein